MKSIKNFFKSDFDMWFESQPKWTQEYMKRQPIWHTRDMVRMLISGILLGALIGFLFGLSL